MADVKTVKLVHANGATVTVDAEKADALVAGGLFTKATTTKK
jgi:hypothetical protein